jgi:2-polyprenyl-3-methyl-5-hydroxy-6-metoxy-1,4-benzoquinol methylase
MITIWSRPSIESAENHMPQEMLTKLGGHIAIHPWWQARARLVSKLISIHLPSGSKRILDVGCGWGVTLKHLEKQGHNVWGLDVGLESLQLLDGEKRNFILGDIENGMIPKQELGKFDVVLALDVLEHLDNPAIALEKITNLTRPGGMVIVTLPAMMELWSEFDAIQGHRKRFSKSEVAGLFENETGLENCRVGYCWPWLVRFARLTRGRKSASQERAEVDQWKVYERYVRPGIWPVRRLMDFVFWFTERSAIVGNSRQGTTILAIGFRKKTSQII